MFARSASHSLAADATSVSSTALRSKEARLITLSTSAVAVCCSSDSVSSRVRACTSSNSRTFSIAITAWSAKVSTSSICLSVNGRTCLRHKMITPIGVPSRMSGTPSPDRTCHFLRAFPKCVLLISKNIRNMNRVALQQDAPGECPSVARYGRCAYKLDELLGQSIVGGKLETRTPEGEQ